MALAGLHVACGYVGGYASISAQIPLLGDVVWSETLASAGTTTRTAPSQLNGADPSFELRSSADVYVAIGPAPDASKASGADDAARILLPANVTRNIFCKPGDKVAWVAA